MRQGGFKKIKRLKRLKIRGCPGRQREWKIIKDKKVKKDYKRLKIMGYYWDFACLRKDQKY